MHSMSLSPNLLQAPLKQRLALYDCDPKVLAVGPGTGQATSITFIPLVTVLTFKHTGLWIPRCHIFLRLKMKIQLPCLQPSGISPRVPPDVSGPSLWLCSERGHFQDCVLHFRPWMLKSPQGLASPLLSWTSRPIDPTVSCPLGGSFLLPREWSWSLIILSFFSKTARALCPAFVVHSALKTLQWKKNFFC